MIRLNAEEYDCYYNNEQGILENQEIERLIKENTIGHILDIGSGTGLGFELANSKDYVGIDIDAERIRLAQEKYGEQYFEKCDAQKYIKSRNNIESIISLFSINYMRPSIIQDIVLKAKNILIIHYNKPYLESSSSYYAGDKEHFDKIHKNTKTELEYWLIKYNFKTTKLLNQDYYYVSILKKE